MPEMGPGYYDVSAADAALRPRTPAVLPGTTARFKSKTDPSKSLGSTYRPQRDIASWHSKGFATSRTERQPLGAPPAVDQMYVVDHGTVSHSIKHTGRKYTASLRSKTDRGDAQVAKVVKDPMEQAMGPGK